MFGDDVRRRGPASCFFSAGSRWRKLLITAAGPPLDSRVLPRGGKQQIPWHCITVHFSGTCAGVFFYFFLMTFYFYTIHSFAHKYLYFPHIGLEKHARDCRV